MNLRIPKASPRPGDFSHRGFSLIELMVAMVIGLILMIGITTVFMSNKQTYKMQNTLTRMQENGRYGVDLIARELRRAGYWGGYVNPPEGSPTDGPEGTVPAATACNTGDNSWGRMIEQGIFGINDANTGYACIPDADYLRGDLLVVRYASPDIADTVENTERLYVRASTLERLIFKGTQDSTAVPTLPLSTTRELVSHAFYIGPTNQQCPDGSTVVPALFWETLNADGITNDEPAEEQLVIGAEHLWVFYGLDTDADGSVESYVDASAVADWDVVIAVRFWLLVRAECPDSTYKNENSYPFDPDDDILPDAEIYTVDDNFRRQIYSATVQLRN